MIINWTDGSYMSKKKKRSLSERYFYQCPNCGGTIIAAFDSLVRIEYICPKCKEVYVRMEKINGKDRPDN